MLVREMFLTKGSPIGFHSGGLFPTHLSFAGSPNMIFREVETTAAFPLATYPVAGNTFRLSMIRADVWKKLGGLDEETFPFVQHDLDFSLRAIKAGYVNLCTSAISASDLTTGSNAEQIDIFALGYLNSHRWEDIFRSCTVIRNLR